MILVFILLQSSLGFYFYVPQQNHFCFTESLSSQLLCLIELSSPQKLSLQVIDPDNYLLYGQSLENHRYSFTALNDGIYKLCLINPHTDVVRINMSVKTGVNAKDYSNIASVNDFKDIELKMRKLEDQVIDIHKKIQFLREREEELRLTNATIHNRVIGYSICTVLMLLCLALIQILYLKRYFKSKKMI